MPWLKDGALENFFGTIGQPRRWTNSRAVPPRLPNPLTVWQCGPSFCWGFFCAVQPAGFVHESALRGCQGYLRRFKRLDRRAAGGIESAVRRREGKGSGVRRGKILL